MKKSDVHVGDKYEFLRMTNKAVKMSGTVVKIHDDPEQAVDMKVDGTGGLESAHINDLIRGDHKQSKDLLSVGDYVKFLRMSNKAVELKGKIVKIHGPGVPCVDIAVDGAGLESAHVDDVVVLEPTPAWKPTVEELQRILNSEEPQNVVINKDGSISAAPKSLTTVNGKAI